MPNEPKFRTIHPATEASVLKKWHEVLWKLIEIGGDIGNADSAARGKISVPLGMLVDAFQELGGELGPCPWAGSGSGPVGKANPGIR